MKTTTKSTETTGAANKGRGAKAPRKARAGVELDAGAQARIKAGVENALQPVAEGPSGEPEPGVPPPPVQPELPAQPEPAETSGGTDAAETSGGTEHGEVGLPVAEVTSGAEAPVPVQPAASVPVPAWRSSPARILRSALSPLDPRWYDWEKLESQIPGVREARALLQTAYETATRLEKAAAPGKPAKRKVEPGAAVRVRAKHAPGYAPLADVTGVLRVTGVAGGQAKVETARGEAVLLPVAHLELAEVAA
ncbi:hypothetical protein [Sorangium sp. So ce1153]|uniref:hypothetical protein n=1 Tax=Sorangium sp. So ce1153 TaxID=3133333 RepID=UPI003F62502E